jgi:hypothetical protein
MKHTVKKKPFFRLQPECHQTNSPLPGIIPAWESLGRDIPEGTGKSLTFFLQWNVEMLNVFETKT